MVAIILPADTSDPGDGVDWSNSIFSEHGHVAYQVKGNQEIQHHDPRGIWPKRQNSTFSEHGHVAH